MMEAFGDIEVVVVHADRHAGGQERVFDRDALVAEDDLVEVGTELGQAEVALVPDDIHLDCPHHVSYFGVVKDNHRVVLEGGFAASRR